MGDQHNLNLSFFDGHVITIKGTELISKPSKDTECLWDPY